jgi:hypothetical protein
MILAHRTFVMTALVAAAAGCSKQSPTVCPAFVAISPGLRLLVPAPNSTGVAANGTIVLYSSSGASVPIALSTNPNPGATGAIATVPTSVPSPYPSAAQTADPSTTSYAVALPQLQAATTYYVDATVHFEDGCGGSGTTQNILGSFTTS